jgi:hypothetical protein
MMQSSPTVTGNLLLAVSESELRDGSNVSLYNDSVIFPPSQEL